MDLETQNYIDQEIAKKTLFVNRKVGDTPTDNYQFVPKTYVDNWDFSAYIIRSNFESLDGWTKTTGAFNYLGYLEIDTTTSANNVQSAYVPTDDQLGLAPNKAKNPIFDCLAFSAGGTYDARVGIGTLSTDNGLGFKMDATTTYALYFDALNVEHTVALSGVNPKTLHRFRIEVIAGSQVLWYVDGLRVYLLDLGTIPIALSTQIMTFYVKTLASSVAKIFGYKVFYKQDF